MRTITLKNVNQEQVNRIRRYCRFVKGQWHEGLAQNTVDLFIKKMDEGVKLRKYYWKDAESYIFHRQGSRHWWVISSIYFWERAKKCDKT